MISDIALMCFAYVGEVGGVGMGGVGGVIMPVDLAAEKRQLPEPATNII